ncbi:hypothetical protein UFOVP14_51 [uncultured Caudovirales phage]|uniref:Uncharacterized protein n=1 Tax=uncultured Caudovirales phage TaxID=2100421 RepID=A0A6J5KHU7_9CAUD|nr:hypothetical protein UFOVP14_51 [uncultured Caudovirales phage]
MVFRPATSVVGMKSLDLSFNRRYPHLLFPMSSGQCNFQSVGRKSLRVTSPFVAFSMATALIEETDLWPLAIWEMNAGATFKDSASALADPRLFWIYVLRFM